MAEFKKNKELLKEPIPWYFGAIEVYWEWDWTFEWKWVDLEKLPIIEKNFWDYKIQYNQYYINNSICTIISWDGILSNYFGYKFTKEEILEQVDVARKDKPPFKDWVWWYIYKWVDLDRNWWNNKHPDKKVKTFKVELCSDLFYELLKKWYMAEWWYRWNIKEYWRDMQDDCIINKVKKLSYFSYWHAIYFVWWDKNFSKYKWKDFAVYIVDSYYWRKCNYYRVDNLEPLKKNWVFFKYVYFYIPEKYIKMTKKLNIPHRKPEEVEQSKRWIIYAWEQEIQKAIEKYPEIFPLFNNYVEWSDQDIIQRMLIDLWNFRMLERMNKK